MMEIRAFTDSLKPEWDSFVARNEETWFWHTTDWMRYSLSCQFNVQCANHSFAVVENEKILAIVPLFVEHDKRSMKAVREIRYGGLPVPAPVVDNAVKGERKNKILMFIFDKVDKIAAEHDALRAVFRLYNAFPLYKNGSIVYNYLCRYGFSDISLSTQVIDLSASETDIYNGFSGNSKREIAKAKKVLSVDFYDSCNITRDIFERFKTFYFDVAGKVTRPDDCFEVLFGLLKTDKAVLTVAFSGDTVVGSEFTIYFQEGAYYLLGAVRRDFEICPIGRLLKWETLQYLKKKQIEYCEMGIQQFGSMSYDFPTEKEISISWFKRRFGGMTVPLFTGEKFYSGEYFRSVMHERMDRYMPESCLKDSLSVKK